MTNSKLDPHADLEAMQARVGLFDLKDMYRESNLLHFSPIMFTVIGITWLLRRISIFEISKRLILGKSQMPAWFLDTYLLFFWSGTAILLVFFESRLPDWAIPGGLQLIVLVALLVIVQILQTSFYHEIWRPERLAHDAAKKIAKNSSNHMDSKDQSQNDPKSDEDLKVTYSRVRNLLISIANYVHVTCLFGFIYWRLGGLFMPPKAGAVDATPPAFGSLLDAIYFSFTIAWSCGSLGIPPLDLGRSGKVMIIFQILSSLVLFSLIVAISIGAVRTTQERSRSKSRKPDSESQMPMETGT